MIATEMDDHTERLPPEDQAEAVRSADKLDTRRQLRGEVLSGLAEQMAHSDDPAEQAALRAAIVRGFYGEGGDA